jgi:ABC-type uncharacterized transport system substrate-binding protein
LGAVISRGNGWPLSIRKQNLLGRHRQVAKVLRGISPSDIPVEQPTQFELAINLRTAKAIGVTLPVSVLLRANQVIE